MDQSVINAPWQRCVNVVCVGWTHKKKEKYSTVGMQHLGRSGMRHTLLQRSNALTRHFQKYHITQPVPTQWSTSRFRHTLPENVNPVRLHRIELNGQASSSSSPAAASLSPPPIVVMHGLMGNCLNWKGITSKIVAQLPPAMRARQRVILVDARNHGDSPWHDGMRYEDMAADLLHLLDEEGIERAILLGHSMGGKAMMKFMLEHEERVDRGIVVDITPASYVDDPRWQPTSFIDGMRAVNLQTITSRQEANDAMRTRIEDPRLRLFLMTNLQRIVSQEPGVPDSWRWRVNLDAVETHLHHIGGPTVSSTDMCSRPVLFIRGDRSFYANDPKYVDTVAPLFPNHAFATVANAGHWCHTDNTEQFVQIASDYIASPLLP